MCYLDVSSTLSHYPVPYALLNLAFNSCVV